MKEYKGPWPPPSVALVHPYVVTFKDGEQLRFSNWKTAIQSAVDRGRGTATVTYAGKRVQALSEYRLQPEFPSYDGVTVEENA